MKQQELRELMAKHRIIATDADGLQKFMAIVCEELEAEGRDVSKASRLYVGEAAKVMHLVCKHSKGGNHA